jgi:hypothetical protein
MKKLMTVALVVLAGVVFFAPIRPVEAQVPMCGACCDSFGNVRCTGFVMPCGGACTCAGIPGYGYAC